MSLVEAVNLRNVELIKRVLQEESIPDEELKQIMFVIYELGYMELFKLFVPYPAVWDLIYYFAVRKKDLELYELVLKQSDYDPIFELSKAHIHILNNEEFNEDEINMPDLMGITPLHLLYWKKMPVKKYKFLPEEDKFGRLPEEFK